MIALFCAVGGVEPQSETVWNQAERYQIPRIAFVNKMDRVGANFTRVLEMMRERFGTNPVPLQIPLGEGRDFAGVVDLIEMKAIQWDEADQGKTFQEIEIPSEFQDAATLARESLVENVASENDELLEKYLEGTEITSSELIAGIRSLTLNGTIIPSTLWKFTERIRESNRSLMQSFRFCLHRSKYPQLKVKYRNRQKANLPDEIRPKHLEKVVRHADDSEPFSALAFKVASHENVDKLVYCRVYSGTLKRGAVVYNVATEKRERVNRILQMHANKEASCDAAYAGDIVALVGMRTTKDWTYIERY